MQEAIRVYIEEESKKGRGLADIGNDIDKARIYEIKEARRKQRIQWRKKNK